MFVWLGDPTVDQFKGDHLVFVAAGSDPFDVITKAVKSVTFSLLTKDSSFLLVLRRISLSLSMIYAGLLNSIFRHFHTARERK